MADWSFPTRIRVGPGRVDELPLACAEAGITRPLVVTDRGLVGTVAFGTVLAALAGTDHVVHTDVSADPTPADVERGLAAFRDHGCDGVVAVGGGSAIDTGKSIGYLAGQHRGLHELTGTEGWRLADPTAIAPVVAVPTTAGTGSEVGRAAVITVELEGSTPPRRAKHILFHPRMLPVSVIADPALTVGMPDWLTAGTGMDALSHALEAYCAPGDHPMADGIAVEAIALVVEHLPGAIAAPERLDARQGMLTAAIMGAVAFQKGLGAMHALSHPLGAAYGVHHGTTNAVLMPFVLAANAPAVTPRLRRLAGRLGWNGGADEVTERLLALRALVGIPHTLAALGVTDPDIGVLATAAADDPSASTNPVPVTPAYAAAVLEAAITGDLGSTVPT